MFALSLTGHLQLQTRSIITFSIMNFNTSRFCICKIQSLEARAVFNKMNGLHLIIQSSSHNTFMVQLNLFTILSHIIYHFVGFSLLMGFFNNVLECVNEACK